MLFLWWKVADISEHNGGCLFSLRELCEKPRHPSCRNLRHSSDRSWALYSYESKGGYLFDFSWLRGRFECLLKDIFTRNGQALGVSVLRKDSEFLKEYRDRALLRSAQPALWPLHQPHHLLHLPLPQHFPARRPPQQGPQTSNAQFYLQCWNWSQGSRLS